LTLFQRIGSESLHARIYEGVFNDSHIAVKVLKKIEQLKNETEINDRVSNSDYFLFMITSLTCETNGIIVMELAISDLKQRLDVITESDLEKMFVELLEALIQLANLQVYHGDLHIGNIFFVLRNSQIKTVIGDFGESEISNSPTSSSSDLFCFINSLRENLIRRPFLNKLNTFFNKIGKVTGECESSFETYLETMTENEALIRCNKDFLYQAISLWNN
jgi:tRNA A-37 threonylcarbamoyl transferase component Bud32